MNTTGAAVRLRIDDVVLSTVKRQLTAFKQTALETTTERRFAAAHHQSTLIDLALVCAVYEDDDYRCRLMVTERPTKRQRLRQERGKTAEFITAETKEANLLTVLRSLFARFKRFGRVSFLRAGGVVGRSAAAAIVNFVNNNLAKALAVTTARTAISVRHLVLTVGDPQSGRIAGLPLFEHALFTVKVLSVSSLAYGTTAASIFTLAARSPSLRSCHLGEMVGGGAAAIASAASALRQLKNIRRLTFAPNFTLYGSQPQDWLGSAVGDCDRLRYLKVSAGCLVILLSLAHASAGVVVLGRLRTLQLGGMACIMLYSGTVDRFLRPPQLVPVFATILGALPATAMFICELDDFLGIIHRNPDYTQDAPTYLQQLLRLSSAHGRPMTLCFTRQYLPTLHGLVAGTLKVDEFTSMTVQRQPGDQSAVMRFENGRIYYNDYDEPFFADKSETDQ